jgi:hypothetical protein
LRGGFGGSRLRYVHCHAHSLGDGAMARVRTNAHPLPVLISWLDSWNGLGAVVTGMERQGYDGEPHPIPRRLARRVPRDHTTRLWVGQVLSFHATPWRAVQVAAREALKRKAQ